MHGDTIIKSCKIGVLDFHEFFLLCQKKSISIEITAIESNEIYILHWTTACLKIVVYISQMWSL